MKSIFMSFTSNFLYSNPFGLIYFSFSTSATKQGFFVADMLPVKEREQNESYFQRLGENVKR